MSVSVAGGGTVQELVRFSGPISYWTTYNLYFQVYAGEAAYSASNVTTCFSNYPSLAAMIA